MQRSTGRTRVMVADSRTLPRQLVPQLSLIALCLAMALLVGCSDGREDVDVTAPAYSEEMNNGEDAVADDTEIARTFEIEASQSTGTDTRSAGSGGVMNSSDRESETDRVSPEELRDQ